MLKVNISAIWYPVPHFCIFFVSYFSSQIMQRVCLLLPILLLAGAPLSRAQEEDQEVTEKNKQLRGKEEIEVLDREST